MTSYKPIAIWLNRALLAVAVGFVLWTGRELVARWDPRGVEVHAGRWALAVGVWMAVQVVQGWAWTRLLVQLSGRPVPSLRAITLHLASQLGRYVPGKAGLPAIRISGAVKLGAEPAAVGSSVLLEVLAWLAVGLTMVLSALLLVARERLPVAVASRMDFGVGLACASGAGVVALAAVDRRVLPARLLEVLRLSGRGPLLSARPLATYALSWTLVFVHGAVCSWAVGADVQAALETAPMYPLAQLGGFLALPVPAGAGVREAILSLTTEDALGAPAALTAGLLSRGTWVLGELGAWALMALFVRGSAGRPGDAQ